MVAWVSVFLAMYSLGMWTLYKYYGARALLNHIARELNQQQMQQQPLMMMDEDGIEMVMNEPQQIQEAAAGMAIQVIEEAMSGNVTPGMLTPVRGSPRRERMGFLSPRSFHAMGNSQDEYDGNILASPAMRNIKPMKLKLNDETLLFENDDL